MTRIVIPPFCVLVTLLAASALPAQVTKAPRRQAAVHFSDGKVLQGEVLLTPGIDFSLGGVPGPGQKFAQTRTFNVDVVKEMSFAPFTRSETLEPERMMVPYKWDTVDRHVKIPTGKPYPVRELGCTVKFNSGEEMTGILASVALYVQDRDAQTGMLGDARRFLLQSKQKGEQNQKMADLVYVTRIRMLDEGKKVAAKTDVVCKRFRLFAGDELTAITRDSLEAVKVKQAGGPDRFEVEATYGENLFLGARVGKKYIVGWPEEGTKRTELFESCAKHLRELRDYFTDRKLLGILPNENNTRIQMLVSLRRRVPPNASKTVSDCEYDAQGKPMEFFRLSVWLWKRDAESGKMILVKRGSFFRVRVDVSEATPEADISADLWPIELKGNQATVGK